MSHVQRIYTVCFKTEIVHIYVCVYKWKIEWEFRLQELLPNSGVKQIKAQLWRLRFSSHNKTRVSGYPSVFYHRMSFAVWLTVRVVAAGLLLPAACSSDHQRAVVVLLLQAHRVHGHLLLHLEEEQPPDHLPSHLPPRQHVQHLVVRHELDPLRQLWVPSSATWAGSVRRAALLTSISPVSHAQRSSARRSTASSTSWCTPTTASRPSHPCGPSSGGRSTSRSCNWWVPPPAGFNRSSHSGAHCHCRREVKLIPTGC